jgi:integrase
MRVRLGEKFCREAEAHAKDYVYWDQDVTGLGLCVYASGRRAFVFIYRFEGRQRRITIGGWPDWSVSAARDHAKGLRREIDLGRDPMGEREALRAAPRIEELAERFIAEHLPGLAARNAADQESMLRKLVLPEWRNRRVDDIEPSDVARLLDKIAGGRARPAKDKAPSRRKPLVGTRPTPIRANRVGEMLRKMFGLSVEWRMRTDNPAAGFRKRVETERERFLNPEEIGRLADAIAAERDQAAASIVRLLLLTGSRLGEVREARFEQFDLHHAVWTKPAAKTKQRRTHRVPLSAEAAAVVRQRLGAVPPGCPWLFPAASPDRPVADIRKFWTSVQAKAGLEGVRLHDLRHTFASLLASGGASLPMIGRLLGHTQSKTTQRYAHLMDSPLRQGVDSVATALRPRLRIVGGEP